MKHINGNDATCSEDGYLANEIEGSEELVVEIAKAHASKHSLKRLFAPQSEFIV